MGCDSNDYNNNSIEDNHAVLEQVMTKYDYGGNGDFDLRLLLTILLHLVQLNHVDCVQEKEAKESNWRAGYTKALFFYPLFQVSE